MIGLGNSGRFGSVSVWKSRWEDGFLWDLWWDRCDGGGRHGVAVKTFFGGDEIHDCVLEYKGGAAYLPERGDSGARGAYLPRKGR